MTEHSNASQEARILALLRERGYIGLTPIAALREVGSFRLGARIWKLRQDGHNIVTERVTTESGARIARYILVEHQSPGGNR